MECEKVMDLESMKKYVEDAFVNVRDKDIYLCGDICEADLTYYFGYFKMAEELGIITEDRQEEMTDILTGIYNDLINGNSPIE